MLVSFFAFHVNPEARGMQNKVIENWEDILLLCSKYRATGQGAKTYEEALEEMAHEEENEVESAHTVPGPSSSTTFGPEEQQKKRSRKDPLANAVTEVALSMKMYFENKKKQERPTGLKIHEVVSKVFGLIQDEVYKANQMLMRGDPEEFYLLEGLPDNEKAAWLQFLIRQ